MLRRNSLVLAAVAFLVVGCSDYQDVGTKQGVGTVLGAAGGGLLGNQFGKGTGNVVATAAGVFLGGMLGNSVGKSLDSADRAAQGQAASRAERAPLGEPIRWNNPKSGNSGSVVATRDGTSSTGAYCREFQQSIVIGGQTQQAFGTACRQPDGSWKEVS